MTKINLHAMSVAVILALPSTAHAIAWASPPDGNGEQRIGVGEAGNFPGVGYLFLNHGPLLATTSTGGCSGTAITRDIVLTAGHCVADEKTGKVDVSGGTFATSLGGTPFNSAFDKVADYGFDPNKIADDLALVHLTTPISDPAFAAPKLVTNASFKNAIYDMVGFGLGIDGSTGNKVSEFGIGRTALNRVDGIDSAGQVFWSTFDAPGPDSQAVVNAAGISEEGRITPGDSGGPAFFNAVVHCTLSPNPGMAEPGCTDANTYLFGINTAATKDAYGYGTQSAGVLVGTYLGWINTEIPILDAPSPASSAPVQAAAITELPTEVTLDYLDALLPSSDGRPLDPSVALLPAVPISAVPEPAEPWRLFAFATAMLIMFRTRPVT